MLALMAGTSITTTLPEPLNRCGTLAKREERLFGNAKSELVQFSNVEMMADHSVDICRQELARLTA